MGEGREEGIKERELRGEGGGGGAGGWKGTAECCGLTVAAEEKGREMQR